MPARSMAALASRISASLTCVTTPSELDDGLACPRVVGRIADVDRRRHRVSRNRLQAGKAARVGLIEGVGALCLHNSQARDTVDQPQGVQLAQRLAECRCVAQVASRHDNPIGRLPGHLLDQLKDDGFLPFEAPGVNRIEQVQAHVLADAARQLRAASKSPSIWMTRAP